jgi:cell division protein FtsW
MLRPGQIVFICALALLTLGVVMVNSASMGVDPVEINPTSSSVIAPLDHTKHSVTHVASNFLLSKSTIYMALAVGAMSLTSLLPIRRLLQLLVSPRPSALPVDDSAARRGIVLLVLGVVMLVGVIGLVYLPGLKREINGAHRWVHMPLGGGRELSIQPSEFAKWGLVLLLAIYASSRASLMPRFFAGLLPALIATGLVAGAVAKEDLGTAVLIASVASIVLLASGARLWHFLMFIPPAILAFIVLVVTSPYRLTRIETFLDPYADPKGAGFHMIQSMAAVAGGGGWGRGLGDGLQKFGYLPEDTTDFLFAIICEELGIAGAALVVFLFIALLWSGLLIVRKQSTTALKLIGLGIVSTVGLQALINLAVVTGMGPTKGIALPLISSGGTGWILTAASLGLLVAMDRSARETPAEVAPLEVGGTLSPA